MPHDSILLSIRRCLNCQSYLSGVGSAPHHTNRTHRLGGWVLRCTDPTIYVRTTRGDTRYGLERGGGAANGVGTARGRHGDGVGVVGGHLEWPITTAAVSRGAQAQVRGAGPLYVQSVLRPS